MKKIYLVFFALLTFTLCACSAAPPGAPSVATSATDSAPVAAPNTAELEKKIIELEKRSWELFKNKQAEEFRKLTVPGYKSLYFGGIKDIEDNLKDIYDIDTKSITFSDMQVSFPVKDVAIITYRYTAESSYKGKDTSGTTVSSGVWVNINGEWKAALYNETRAEPQPKK